jgi:hypothetical protein
MRRAKLLGLWVLLAFCFLFFVAMQVAMWYHCSKGNTATMYVFGGFSVMFSIVFMFCAKHLKEYV